MNAIQPRYISCRGFVLGIDFIVNTLGIERCATISMLGATVYLVFPDEHTPCLFITFGISGSTMPNVPICLEEYKTEDDVSTVAMSRFLQCIDPNCAEKSIQIRNYHVDLHESKAILLKTTKEREINEMRIKNRKMIKRPVHSMSSAKRVIDDPVPAPVIAATSVNAESLFGDDIPSKLPVDDDNDLDDDLGDDDGEDVAVLPLDDES